MICKNATFQPLNEYGNGRILNGNLEQKNLECNFSAMNEYGMEEF
jgi:hypothetical protein